MIYRSFEANYLISLLSSVLGKKNTPVPVRALDWREFFLLSEFHDVSGTSYYALLGLTDKVPSIWHERFSKKFRKFISDDYLQNREIERVLKALDTAGIVSLVLTEWIMKKYYPQKDMRLVEDIEILYDSEKEKLLRSTMQELGYHYEGADSSGDTAFYQTINCRFVFKKQLFPHNRKFCAGFSKIWKKAVLQEGSRSLYALPLDEFYLLLISRVCDRYADGNTDIRDIMDIHLFLKVHREELNFAYIDTMLGALGTWKFSKYLEQVADLWFGNGNTAEEDFRTYGDIEDYIISKGVYGRETSMNLLPLINDLKIWRIQDERREQIKRAVRWFFPGLRYMKGIYPVLDKIPVLIWLFWIFRLLRLFFFAIHLKFARIYHSIFFSFDKVLQRLLHRREEKEEIERELEKGMVEERDRKKEEAGGKQDGDEPS